ncbi:MAG TPA: hypothetical protein VFA87_07780, partial [Rhizomicrobium sp.]|nr:hypothetical protein [Rhizomicrobium sp.]
PRRIRDAGAFCYGHDIAALAVQDVSDLHDNAPPILRSRRGSRGKTGKPPGLRPVFGRILRSACGAGKALSLPRCSSFALLAAKSRGKRPFTPQQAALSQAAF